MYLFCNRAKKCTYDITITYTPVCVCVCLRACVSACACPVFHVLKELTVFQKVCMNVVSLEVIPAPYRLVYYSHE